MLLCFYALQVKYFYFIFRSHFILNYPNELIFWMWAFKDKISYKVFKVSRNLNILVVFVSCFISKWHSRNISIFNLQPTNQKCNRVAFSADLRCIIMYSVHTKFCAFSNLIFIFFCETIGNKARNSKINIQSCWNGFGEWSIYTNSAVSEHRTKIVIIKHMNDQIKEMKFFSLMLAIVFIERYKWINGITSICIIIPLNFIYEFSIKIIRIVVQCMTMNWWIGTFQWK